MLKHRVIPVLLVKDGRLVKTRRFRDPSYIGDPINAVKIFSEKEVDELTLLDISASRRGGINLDLIEEIASECFMPLGYGGGVKSLEDAQSLFRIGVEKVILRTAAMQDMRLVRAIADFGGQQSVAVAVDVTTDRFGRQRLEGGARTLGKGRDWRAFLRQAVEAGAGEIVLTCVGRDGTMAGMDGELIAQAAAICPVPLVAVGGVGTLDDIKQGIVAGADAIGAGAFFVFRGPHRAVLITYPDYELLTQLLDDRE